MTLVDKDGDSVLPNGELVDTVTLVSDANGVDASTDSMQEPMPITYRKHRQRLGVVQR